VPDPPFCAWVLTFSCSRRVGDLRPQLRTRRMPGRDNLLGFAFDVRLKPLPKGPRSLAESRRYKMSPLSH
jgi:hypothetical protein